MFANGRAAEDSGEAGADRAQFELLALQERDLRAELTEVDHALSKFAGGTYGLCERCVKPIPLDRLRVVPETRFDVQHQEEAEAQQRTRTRTRTSVAPSGPASFR